MRVQEPRSELALSKGFIKPQDQYLHCIMDDVRTAAARNPTPQAQSSIQRVEGKKLEHCRSFSQGQGERVFRYFTSESLCLLVCLTASLLILPLILPPLPPPPFLLLLLPICIMAVLMVLAFMPSDARDATYTYV